MDITSCKTHSLFVNQLGPLSEIDTNEMHDLEKLIDQYKNLPDKPFIKILLDIPYVYLIKWYSYSEKIKFFLENDPTFLNELTSKLALANFISIEVKSLKTNEIVNVFNHYIAASFYQTYWINLVKIGSGLIKGLFDRYLLVIQFNDLNMFLHQA
jgi:hypothetical protein